MLRILYDDFDQKVKNIHDEMDLHHSYIKKACSLPAGTRRLKGVVWTLRLLQNVKNDVLTMCFLKLFASWAK